MLRPSKITVANSYLLQGVKNLFDVLHGHINTRNPLQKPDSVKRKFREGCKRVVSTWSLKNPGSKTDTTKVIWPVFKAVVRREGGPYCSKTNPEYTYDWIPSL